MRRRPILLLIATMLALIVAAPPVSATEVLSKGKVGEYQVYDSDGSADAICRYLAGGAIDRITVKNPFVHSSNYLSNPSQKQWVGWRVVLERRKPGDLTWSRYYRSGFVKKQATQIDIASFADRTFDIPSTNHQWRVRSIIRWYQPGTTDKTIGTVIYRYDWYKRIKSGDPMPDHQPSYCIPEY